jgi:hypothetical protein
VTDQIDLGQRYVALYCERLAAGAAAPWVVLGYSETLDGAEALCATVANLTSTASTMVRDRRAGP